MGPPVADMPRNISSTAPKSLSPQVTPAKRAPPWIRGFKPNRRKRKLPEKRSFPVYAGRPSRDSRAVVLTIKLPRKGGSAGSLGQDVAENPIPPLRTKRDPRPIRRRNPA